MISNQRYCWNQLRGKGNGCAEERFYSFWGSLETYIETMMLPYLLVYDKKTLYLANDQKTLSEWTTNTISISDCLPSYSFRHNKILEFEKYAGLELHICITMTGRSTCGIILNLPDVEE